MQVTREDLNPCTVQLQVVCEPTEVKEGFDKAFKQISKSIKMPGFRPGSVPRSMAEKMIDPTQLHEAAADNIIRSTFKKAIEKEALQPDQNTRPSVNLTNINQEEQKCEYTAKVPLPPVIELGDYKQIPIERPPLDVTEEEVEYQVEEIRKRRSTREPITDRGIQEGDVAVLNIKADGEEGEGRNFMTIAGQTFPQLDVAIMGMKVEEMKHLDVTFPENFQEKDWAGKPMKVQVTLNSANSVKLPDLDETFAQSLRTGSVDELKSMIRTQLGQAKQQMLRELMIEQAMERLLERSKIEVSDNTWEDIANRRLAETDLEQRREGKSMEQYAEANGMTLEELVNAWREKAHLYIKRAFMIREVFTKENMMLTNEELNMELLAMAQEYEVKPEEMLATLQKQNALEELRFRSVSRKVSDFLIENAEVKEVALTGA